ncbi:MAG: universal stress protein [Sphingomonas sp.]|jgi:nucleotide-binding universal stress UspA family protein|uniref:universal stress protein n=1 Tax=Sphingomonas sp. TaxID=28214 RepID=UPI0035662B8A
MKNILVLIHDDSGQNARVQTALDVARAVGGHLRCVDVSIVPEVVTDYVSMGGGALLRADEELNEASNRTRVRERLENDDVPFDWIDTSGDLTESMRAAAALTDLVVVNRELQTSLFPNALELAGRLLVEARLPVLAVPETAKGLDIRGRALIAWDGSPSAEAALRAAVPLLRHAGSVTILYVEDGSLKIPPEDAAIYLSRHGIEATIQREKILMDRPGAVILSAQHWTKADYVVMGAFGRARVIEELFGGATERLLTESPVPLFLVHGR